MWSEDGSSQKPLDRAMLWLNFVALTSSTHCCRFYEIQSHDIYNVPEIANPLKPTAMVRQTVAMVVSRVRVTPRPTTYDCKSTESHDYGETDDSRGGVTC